MKLRSLLPLLVALGGLAVLAGCDSGFGGEPLGNQPPETFLSVRDTSLADNLCTPTPAGPVCSEDDDIFTSTVYVAWSGVDPDGFVVGYELRYYDISVNVGPEEGWHYTTSRDTVILLPILPGQATAQVVFEVRAIDNEGLKDPTPARTVFPIVNSPPNIRLVAFELPPDTTWTVISFGFEATDPDGPDDLAAVEISLNDQENFVELPPTVSFITLVAENAQPGDSVADARVYFGRSFAFSDVVVPGLRLDDDNTLYIRSVDRTGARSNTLMFPDPDFEQTWFVRQPKSNVLLVNDVRTTRADETMPFHAATLAGYLPAGATFDVWDLSRPTAGVQHSEMLPPVANPTLRETLRQWDYIYWVSSNVTASVQGSNLALASVFLEQFLADGGRLFVQVPFTAPPGGEIDFNNPSYDLLPAESVVLLPGSDVPPNLAIQNNAAVLPAQAVPGTGRTLPELRAQRLAFTLPYTISTSTSVALYTGTFVDRDDNNAPWTGSSIVASMDLDRRVGLLALQLYTRDRYDFAGPGGDGEAPCLAVQYMLEGLTFPGAPGQCPAP